MRRKRERTTPRRPAPGSRRKRCSRWSSASRSGVQRARRRCVSGPDHRGPVLLPRGARAIAAGRGPAPQAVSGSTGDPGAVVARARAEADEIVRGAHEQAAGIRAAASSGDARGVVAPFLNREREFLQSLGGLVQTHAEEIKQMVLAVRERVEASPVPEAARPTVRRRRCPKSAPTGDGRRGEATASSAPRPRRRGRHRAGLGGRDPRAAPGERAAGRDRSGGGGRPPVGGDAADRRRFRDRARLLDGRGARDRATRTLPARALLGRGLSERSGIGSTSEPNSRLRLTPAGG